MTSVYYHAKQNKNSKESARIADKGLRDNNRTPVLSPRTRVEHHPFALRPNISFYKQASSEPQNKTKATVFCTVRTVLPPPRNHRASYTVLRSGFNLGVSKPSSRSKRLLAADASYFAARNSEHSPCALESSGTHPRFGAVITRTKQPPPPYSIEPRVTLAWTSRREGLGSSPVYYFALRRQSVGRNLRHRG